MQRQIGNAHGLTLRGGTDQLGGSTFDNLHTDINTLHDAASMKAALTAFNGTRYSAANLAKRTYNDLVFACRREGVIADVYNDF